MDKLRQLVFDYASEAGAYTMPDLQIGKCERSAEVLENLSQEE